MEIDVDTDELMDRVRIRYLNNISGLEYWTKRVVKALGNLTEREPPFSSPLSMARAELFADATVALTATAHDVCNELVGPPRAITSQVLFAVNATRRTLIAALDSLDQPLAEHFLHDCLDLLGHARAELVALLQDDDDDGRRLLQDAERLVNEFLLEEERAK